MGRQKLYNGTSQQRHKSPKVVTPEERKAKRLKSSKKNREFKLAVKDLIRQVDEWINTIAEKFNKHPDTVRLEFGGQEEESHQLLEWLDTMESQHHECR